MAKGAHVSWLCDLIATARASAIEFTVGASSRWQAQPTHSVRRKALTTVVRKDSESFDGLLRRFRKQVQQERIMTTVRRRRFFEKPSQTRKRKAAKKRIKSRRTTLKMQRRRY